MKAFKVLAGVGLTAVTIQAFVTRVNRTVFREAFLGEPDRNFFSNRSGS